MKTTLLLSSALLFLAGTALSPATTAVFAIGTQAAGENVTAVTETAHDAGYTSVVFANGSSTTTYTATTTNASWAAEGIYISTSNGYTIHYQSLGAGTYEALTSGSTLSNASGSAALQNVTGLDEATLSAMLSTYTGAANTYSSSNLSLYFVGLTVGSTYTVALVVGRNGSASSSSIQCSIETVTSAYYGSLSGSDWTEVDAAEPFYGTSTDISTSSSEKTIICFSFTAESELFNVSVPDSGGASLVAITEGAVAIPEPSAVGLLAGLGALAFVATRRRRRGVPAGIFAGEARK